MTGQLDILSCGEGDIKITFDENNIIESERAKRIIQDMLKRGYSLFIHGKDNALIRVKKFIAKSGTYIIADGATVPAEAEEIPAHEIKRGVRFKGLKKLPMHKAKATVVGRSAGG